MQCIILRIFWQFGWENVFQTSWHFFFQIGIWDFSLRVNWAISSIIDDLSSWRGHACLNFAVFVVLSKIFSNFPARLSCRMSDTLTPTFAKILWNVNRSLSLKSTEEISFVWSAKISFEFLSSVREHLTGKKLISFGHCPNYLSPPSPQFGQVVKLFLDVKNDVYRILQNQVTMIIRQWCEW